jgi:probable HAF family extracellular repeat protein
VLPGATSSIAQGMNFDGSIIVGRSDGASRLTHAVVWRNGQVQSLSTLAGFTYAAARAVTADGSFIVGSAYSSSFDSIGCVWTPTTGPQLFENFLATHGITFPAGWRSDTLTAVSDDGMTIAGTAFRQNPFGYQGFVVTIPAPSAITVGGIAGVIAVGRSRRAGALPPSSRTSRQRQPNIAPRNTSAENQLTTARQSSFD